MNKSLEDGIVELAVSILHSHAMEGTAMTKDEANIIMMASKIGEPPPKTPMEKFIGEVSQLGKLAPMVMDFFGLGGSNG